MTNPDVLPARFSRDEQSFYARYELPHHVYTSKIYPVQSPNGSTIIVFGHDHGIRVLWRGGKPFRRPKEESQEKPAMTNGTDKDTPMNLDSDDEPEPKEEEIPLLEDVQFEEDNTHAEETIATSPILQDLDILLGSQVQHIATPSIPPGWRQGMTSSLPAIVSHKVVLTVSCSDRTTRVVTLPLTPPSPAMKKRRGLKADISTPSAAYGSCGEHVLVVGSSSAHQQAPDCISMTFTPRPATFGEGTDPEDSSGDEGLANRPTTSWGSRPPGSPLGPLHPWDLLIATHSPETSGLMQIYKVSIVHSVNDGTTLYGISKEQDGPVQIIHLSKPALTISFNPSLYPAPRHSRLLVVESSGSIRVYDCVPSSAKRAKVANGRRGLANDPDFPSQGSWLISLYTGFEKLYDEATAGQKVPSPRAGQRKRILDAKWVLGGKGIIALLSDGEWGVWDLEGNGPSVGTSAILAGNSERAGLKGGSTTTFSLSGWVTRQQSRGPTKKSDAASNFAPRTPHTRQREEKKLFGGASAKTGGYVRGGIAIHSMRGHHASLLSDEMILFRYDETLAAITSLRSYWEAQIDRDSNGGTLFNHDGRDRLLRLDGVDLRGEALSDVDISGSIARADSNEDNQRKTITPVMLITGQHRVIFVSTVAPGSAKQFSRAAQEEQPSESQRLALGEMDTTGIDQALARMDSSKQWNGSIPKRKVGFACSS